MLLSFEIDGYKLFDQRIRFSMSGNKRIKKGKENLVVKKVDNKEYSILKSSIIYGPNNSGKTTFIKSLSVLKSIIDKESIDEVTKDVLNFNFFDEILVIEFLIEFISNDKHYLYELSFNEKNEITKEILKVNSKVILDRYGKNNKKIEQVLSLLGHYKNKLMVMTLPKDYEDIHQGFKDFFAKLVILQYINDNVQATISMLQDPLYQNDFIRLIKKSDTNIKEIKINKNNKLDGFPYVNSDIADYLKLESTYEKDGRKISFPSILIDSVGTKKLIVYASYIIKALKEHYVLVVDELDSSWHTILTRNIFALFNSVSNENAQIIASCHDLLLLDDERMFRRDQIWFTYKDAEGTYFYSLGDFKKEPGSHKGGTLTNYLKGKYGALPYPDLGEIINADEQE